MARKSLDVLLDRVERQHELSPEEARDLLAGCTVQIAVLDRLCEQTKRSLDRGIEAQQLRSLVKELVDDLDRSIKAFSAACAKVNATDLPPPEKMETAAFLENAIHHALNMRGDLSTLLRRLETPPPQFDPRTFPAGREDPAAAGYISLDDVTARLLEPRQT